MGLMLLIQSRTGNTPIPIASAAISNLQLYLAVETEPNIIARLTEQVITSGISLNIPFVYSYNNNLTGPLQVTTLRFNGSMGTHLKKIYHCFFSVLIIRQIYIKLLIIQQALKAGILTLIS